MHSLQRRTFCKHENSQFYHVNRYSIEVIGIQHEKAIDAERLRDAAAQEDTSPGPILGQFCGTIRNASELAVSTENALTLWWHTDAELPLNHKGEGFRLLWSAFRKSNIGKQ